MNPSLPALSVGPTPHLLITGVTPGCLWSEEALDSPLHKHSLSTNHIQGPSLGELKDPRPRLSQVRTLQWIRGPVHLFSPLLLPISGTQGPACREGTGMDSQGHRIKEVRATVQNPLVATRSLLESWVVTVEEATFWGAEGEPLLQPTSQVPS